MITGWNYIWGESWKDYVQRYSITSDLTAAQRESTQAMIGAIDGLNESFQWGFGQMIAQMGGMNDSLNTLIKLAKEEVQRLAYNHFEIARDAYRRALYEECLEELDKAINGDHVSPGYKLEWRFHLMQAVIHLGFFGCNPDLVDPGQAEQSFCWPPGMHVPMIPRRRLWP